MHYFLYFLVVTGLLFGPLNTWAQTTSTPAVSLWSFEDQSAPYAPTSVYQGAGFSGPASNLLSGTATYGSGNAGFVTHAGSNGSSPDPTLYALYAKNWPLTGAGPDPARYFEFTITPKAGYSMNVNGMLIGDDSVLPPYDPANPNYTNADYSGPTSYVIRSSVDGFTSDVATKTTVNVNYTSFNPSSGINGKPAFQNLTGPVTFRIYPYDATSATGSFLVDLIRIFARLTPLPTCNAGTSQVALSSHNAPIACSATSTDLTTLVTSTAPANTSLVWYTTADHSGAQYTTPATATAGTYYAFIYDATNSCYNTSASSASVVVTNATGCPVPDLTPIIYARSSTVHTTSSITVVVDVLELLNAPTTGLITVKVSKDALTSLSFSSGTTTLDSHVVQNSVWSFDGVSDPNYYILTTTSVIAGSDQLSFGLTGTLTPGATSGLLTLSTVIIGGSGGENKIINNNDADRIDYFQL